ncbi:hypothetical protein F5146DRAFT_1006910 [Armillaria mellea]|nr:hypothetical protein F5146DRAFT_1006910 [Armillaria mellea]
MDGPGNARGWFGVGFTKRLRYYVDALSLALASVLFVGARRVKPRWVQKNGRKLYDSYGHKSCLKAGSSTPAVIQCTNFNMNMRVWLQDRRLTGILAPGTLEL